jgi:Zn finger protein HypA/HybF involved in hydrogenase expression
MNAGSAYSFADTGVTLTPVDEAGLAQQIIEACAVELLARGGRPAVCVGLRIGPAAPVNPDALRFCFDALKQDTPLRLATLDIECPAIAPAGNAAAVDIRYLEFAAGPNAGRSAEAPEKLHGRVEDSTPDCAYESQITGIR